MSIELSDLKFKNSLKSYVIYNTLVENITKIIREIPNFDKLGKSNNELILLICNIIENKITNNKKKKIDKKNLVLDVIHNLFCISADDRKNIGEIIQFLFDNNKIKKEKISKVVSKSLYNWIKKKVL